MQMVGGYVLILDRFVTIDSVGSGLRRKKDNVIGLKDILYIFFYTK